MTPTDSGRNRRRRGRRSGRPNAAVEGEQTPAVQADATQEPAARRAEIDGEATVPARNRPEAFGQQRGAPDAANRKRTRGKRRSPRRSYVEQSPGEVLKRSVRHTQPRGTIRLRQLEEVSTSDGITLGCPMLTRTRIAMPFANGQRSPRCSMGWAIHGEEEASMCMRTPNRHECWKEHPEREAALRASSSEDAAAD